MNYSMPTIGFRTFLPFAVLFLLLGLAAAKAAPANVAIVVSDALGPPIRHGTAKLTRALEQKGVRLEKAASLQAAGANTEVVAGLASGPGEVARLVADLGLKT